MSHPSRQPVLFQGLNSRPIHVAFDTDLQSSDGGGLLLGALDRKLGLTAALASCFSDSRDPSKTRHSRLALLRQGVYSRALGYPDGNDAAVLGGDPVLQTVCGRDPGPDSQLGSQPTLSRFESAPSRHELYAATLCFEEQVMRSLRHKHRKARLLTIDLDGTHDPVHGAQQLGLFNGFYDCYCYQPLLGFLTVDDQPEQWLFHTRLRSGRAYQVQGVIPLLRRIVPKLRRLFRRAKIRVRLDGGFATPRLLAALEALKVQYVIGMPGNQVLQREIAELLDDEVEMAAVTGETQRSFASFVYWAGSWPRLRRVVAKVEALVHEGRAVKRNPRFVVTNLAHKSEKVYQIYCGRGDSENRIKELKDDLQIDRTSCSNFRANIFRVLQTAAAYALYQELRWKMRKTRLGRAQVGTLRLQLMKIGVRIVASVRRLVLHGPKHWPWIDDWLLAAKAVGAIPA